MAKGKSTNRELVQLANAIRGLETQLVRLKAAYDRLAPNPQAREAMQRDLERKKAKEKREWQARDEYRKARESTVKELSKRLCPGDGWEYHSSDRSGASKGQILARAISYSGSHLVFKVVPGLYCDERPDWADTDEGDKPAVAFSPDGWTVFKKVRKNQPGSDPYRKCQYCDGHGWVQKEKPLPPAVTPERGQSYAFNGEGGFRAESSEN